MEDQNTNSNFKTWAIVEVFGHEKYAGYVEELQIGGTSMLKIEVPNTGTGCEYPLPGFTKIFNPSSVFSITPVSEDYAKEMANRLRKHPITAYEHKNIIETMAEKKFGEMTMEKVQEFIFNAQHKLPNPQAAEDNELPM